MRSLRVGRIFGSFLSNIRHLEFIVAFPRGLFGQYSLICHGLLVYCFTAPKKPISFINTHFSSLYQSGRDSTSKVKVSFRVASEFVSKAGKTVPTLIKRITHLRFQKHIFHHWSGGFCGKD